MDLYKTFDNEICEMFKTAPISRISYFDGLPLSKDLCQNWHGLQMEINTKFINITKEQDEAVVWKIDQCCCLYTIFCKPCKKWGKCMDHLKCQEPQSSFNPFKFM